MLGDLEITDENGKDIAAVISYRSPSDANEQKRTVSDKIEIDFGHDEDLPEQINISANIDVGNSPSMIENKTWDVRFTIDYEKLDNHKEVFQIKKTVIVEGQKITLKYIIVKPY